MNTSKEHMKSKPHGSTGTSSTENSGPKKDPQMFEQQRSDTTQQGQQMINEQPMAKQ